MFGFGFDGKREKERERERERERKRKKGKERGIERGIEREREREAMKENCVCVHLQQAVTTYSGVVDDVHAHELEKMHHIGSSLALLVRISSLVSF